MDYYVNSKSEEETIYEIYKSCRLCGAGAGYKMPIIQNVINLDPDDTELKQKIRECVQIEVHQDDKMPPLICELCVDKVNDFYEFLEMCKQTNKKTRLRLGLPPQAMPRGAPDAGDCILGVTEPVFINDSNSSEPILSRSNRSQKTVKIKDEPKVNTKFHKMDEAKTPKSEFKKEDSKIRLRKKYNVIVDKETRLLIDSNISRIAESSSFKGGRSRLPSQPPPPRTLRGTKRPTEDDVPLSKQTTRKTESTPIKSILKKVEITDDSSEPRSKRLRDGSRETVETPKKELNKKVKVMVVNIPKMKVPPPAPPATSSHKCPKCKVAFKTLQALSSHLNTHITVVENVDMPKLSPKPAPGAEKKPKTQKCTKCDRNLLANMVKSHKCTPKYLVHQCKFCERKFQASAACATHEKFCNPKLEQMLQCKYCERRFSNMGARTTHEKACKPAPTPPRKSKSKWKIPQLLKSQLLPMEVRLARCDPLCDDKGHCRDASFVDHDYGLDKQREYPYLYNLSMLTHKLRIKSELAMYDRMVKIQDGIKDEFDLDECYKHWDSASESDSDAETYSSRTKNGVKPLSTLSLKVLFSPKGLGRVPKKLRKIKSEKPFDSILNSTELDSDIKFGISNIISSLEDSINDSDNTKDFMSDKTKDEDALFGENKGPGVKNSDFDSLFGNTGSADSSQDKLSYEDIQREASPTLNLGDVHSRLSGTDHNTSVDNENSSSLSKTENTDTSIENDSQSKLIVSRNSSFTKSNAEENIVEEKEAVESKEGDIEKSNEDSIVNEDEMNSSSEEKNIENDENHYEDKTTDATKNSNQESEITDYTKRSEVNNAEVPKEITSQKEVYREQNSSTNGDSELSEKMDMDDMDNVSDTDMDDGKLMEAIDAQLGESDNGKAIDRQSDDFTKDIEY